MITELPDDARLTDTELNGGVWGRKGCVWMNSAASPIIQWAVYETLEPTRKNGVVVCIAMLPKLLTARML